MELLLIATLLAPAAIALLALLVYRHWSDVPKVAYTDGYRDGLKAAAAIAQKMGNESVSQSGSVKFFLGKARMAHEIELELRSRAGKVGE